jgi:ATP-binding protein involved in chromosome partitioning
LRQGGDRGVPIVVGDPDSASAKALKAIALAIAGKVSVAALT